MARSTETNDLALWLERIRKGEAPLQSDINLAKRTAVLVETVYRLSLSEFPALR